MSAPNPLRTSSPTNSNGSVTLLSSLPLPPSTPSPLPSPLPTTSASPATVWCSNKSCTVNSTPRSRARPMIRTHKIESPPNSKKFSSLPTRSTPRASAHTSANISSTPFRGPSYSLPLSSNTSSGFGSFRRSTFPFPVSGNPSTTTTTGTMYSGSFFLTPSRTSTPFNSTPSSPTTYPTNCLSPPPFSHTTATASFTPPCSRNATSTSPNSIRYPRTFTCSSLRPTNSTSPLSFHRPTSPVRYIRSPPPPTPRPPHTPACSRSAYQSALPSPSPLPTPQNMSRTSSSPSAHTHARLPLPLPPPLLAAHIPHRIPPP